MGGGACAGQAEDHILQLLTVRQLAAQASVGVLDLFAGPTLQALPILHVDRDLAPTIVMNIQTSDAGSFRASQGSILAYMNRAMRRSQLRA